uniref:SAP domain-containing protein n=1 Tax=Setaria digitata TaxID=48799 RepID=A0A915PUV4_9BILA
MATRSRRSAAGSDSLNPAMIQLYDTGRLRRELKQRGLDTTGTRNVLADRLQEAVLSERNSRQTYSPPPQTEKPTKRGTKRSLKGDEENENETSLDAESIISPQPKKSRHSEELDEINLIEESFSIELSNISSIDEVQMEAEKAFVPHCLPATTTVHPEPFPMLEGEKSLISNEEANSRAEPKVEVVPSEPKKPRTSPDERKEQESNCERKINEKMLVEQEQSSSSDDEELKWLYKTRREKKARKTLFEDDLNKNDNESDEITEASAVKSVSEESQMSEKEVEGSGRERSSKSSSIESSKTDNVVSMKDKPAKTLMQKGSIKIKLKTNLLKTTIERISEPKRKETPSGLAGIVTKDGKMHVDGMLAAISQEKRRSFTPPLSSPNAEKRDQASRKKIPLRMQAPVDVLDSIFDKQAQLLSSKYKTEQERALERQKLEMEKRRQNAIPPIASSSTASSAGLEKRKHVDFVIPSKSSQEQRVAQHHSPWPAPPDLRPHIPPSSRHIRESTNVDEKRLLAQLPPPPPPPPFLPHFAKVSMPSTSTFSFDSTSSIDHPRVESVEETIVGHYAPFMTPTTPCSSDSPLSVRTPPSVPHYRSPSETSVEHLHSIEASTSCTTSVTKIDSERIKEMASALQAVFARLGSVPPPPAAPKLDIAENALKETTVVMISDPTTIDKKSASSIVEEHEITNKSTKAKSGLVYGNLVCEASSTCVVGHESTHSARIMQGIASTSVSSSQKSDASAPLQSLSSLSDTGHFTEKEISSHLPGDIENDCESEAVVSIVEEVVCATVMGELSISSNHSEDKNKKSDEVSEKEELERKPDISEDLLRDPRRLLQKASDVLKNLQSLEIAAEQAYAEKQNQQQYEQLPLDEKYEDDDNEDKPLPDFHGEPVPDSDDEIIIEGVTRKRSTKKNAIQEEEPIPGDEQIEVDFYNADLNVKASETSQEIIDPDNGDGFALMWGGARSTYGVRIPSDVTNFPAVVFQIKLLECLPIKHLPFEEIDAHDIRVGWSAQNSTNILGEAPHSYAYDLLAKKATNNFFMDYGEPCQVGDVVTSCLDLALGKIYFWKNTEYLGVAFSEVSFNENDIVFPHICTKNYKLSVNYGDSQSDGWILVAELQKDEALNTNGLPIYFSKLDRTVLVRGPVPPSSKSECTVLMMVGLPGVGKTTWVRQYLREHPQEQWTLLSTDTILAAMKVNGVSRSRVHQGRWDMIMGLIAKALNRSLHLACRRRRNYIIDQTNVSKEARRRKLSQFKDFQRKCVVIIPSEEEMTARQMKQSRMDGAGPIPVEAMLELKAMLSIPNVETEPIEDVFFVEPPLERIGDAIDLVLRFNEEARPWCQKRRNRRGESLRQNDSRLMNNARLSNDVTPAVTNINAHDGNQLNGQPSPTDTRQNEGCCAFERELTSSLTSSVASSWAERKNTSIS